jgi:hypothetical protein
VHQQEVTDEQGRRRFHGAFTGGFSAGYYNTVGSKVRSSSSSRELSLALQQQQQQQQHGACMGGFSAEYQNTVESSEQQQRMVATSFAAAAAAAAWRIKGGLFNGLLQHTASNVRQ